MSRSSPAPTESLLSASSSSLATSPSRFFEVVGTFAMPLYPKQNAAVPAEFGREKTLRKARFSPRVIVSTGFVKENSDWAGCVKV